MCKYSLTGVSGAALLGVALAVTVVLSGCMSTYDDKAKDPETTDARGGKESAEGEERIDLELMMNAYVVLEYQRAFNGLDVEDVVLEIEEIGASYETELSQRKHEAFFSGLSELARGNFAEAHDLIDEALADLELSPSPDVAYVMAVASARRPEASLLDIERLVNLERHFMDNPRYYYHTWNAMKDGPGNYSFEAVYEILERTILLASDSEAAEHSRQEIASLQGVDLQEGQRFLVGAEMDAAAVRMLEHEDQRSFDSVANMLNLQENLYTEAAMLVLAHAAAQSDWVVEAITEYSQHTDNELAAGRSRRILDSLE